jgi:lipopolysaccharide export system permease protein
MRILDKYIIREVFLTFIFGIFAFSAVFVGSGTLFRIAEYVTQYGASVTAVLRLFVFSLPSIIVLTFPMSMLLATLLTFGKLSGSSELTAMKSCGISFSRIAVPVLFVAFFVSIFAIAFSEFVVPKANEAYNNIVHYELQGNTLPKSQDHIIVKEIKDNNIQRLVYARHYDATTNSLQGVSVQEFQKEVLVHVENAEYATWESDHWTMYNGILYDFSDGDTERTIRFDKQNLPILQDPKELVREQKDPEELTMKELRTQINIMKSQYVDTKKLEMELYQRITIPMASLVFALIGTPLGLQPNRTSSSIGFGLSIIIIFIYYSIMTLSSALGQGGILAPIYAAWLPNLIGLIVGAILLRKAAK